MTFSNTGEGVLRNGRIVGMGESEVLYSIDFNGSSNYIQTGLNGTDFPTSGGLTIAFWAKGGDLATRECFVGCQDDAGGAWDRLYIFKETSEYLRFGCGDKSPTAATGSYDRTVWQHIAVTLDESSNNTSVYLDGVAVISGNSDAVGAELSAEEILIGAMQGPGSSSQSQWFSGLITDYRIYAEELSGSQISDLAAGTHVEGTALTQHLKFTESSGSSAEDSSGNSNTATLVGSPTWSADIPAELS